MAMRVSPACPPALRGCLAVCLPTHPPWSSRLWSILSNRLCHTNTRPFTSPVAISGLTGLTDRACRNEMPARGSRSSNRT